MKWWEIASRAISGPTTTTFLLQPWEKVALTMTSPSSTSEKRRRLTRQLYVRGALCSARHVCLLIYSKASKRGGPWHSVGPERNTWFGCRSNPLTSLDGKTLDESTECLSGFILGSVTSAHDIVGIRHDNVGVTLEGWETTEALHGDRHW